MSMTVTVTGHKALGEALKSIAPILYKNRLKKTVEKAAKVVELRAIRNASKTRDTGALSRAIVSKGTVRRDGKGATGIVGIETTYTESPKPRRPGSKDRKKAEGAAPRIIPVKYAALVEFGMASRPRAGDMPERPFLRPALATSGQEVFGIMANEMRAGLEQAQAKAAAKGGSK